MKKLRIVSAAVIFSLAGSTLCGCSGGAPMVKDGSTVQKESSFYSDNSTLSTAALKTAAGEKKESAIESKNSEAQQSKESSGIPEEESSRESLKESSDKEPDSSTEQSSSAVTELGINNCIIEGIENITYDGETHTPDPRITYGDRILRENRDYRIGYGGTIREVGEYRITITFIGDYTGSIQTNLSVLPPVASLEEGRVSSEHLTIKLKLPQEYYDGCEIEYSYNRDFTDSKTVSVTKADGDEVTLDIDPDKAAYYFRTRVYYNYGDEVLYSEYSGRQKITLSLIEEIDGITYVDGIIIANKTYSLPSSYDPGEDAETFSAFYKMADAAAADGLSLWVCSGYRSYATQEYTYNYFVNDRGVAEADRCSARPGHSEHQTGMAIDVNTTSSAFEGTPEAVWLENNCYKFGFIIRYPKGKEDITGYKYEPWHIRYIGREKAEKIYKSGLTIEEYYGITSSYDG